jgi:hypothetical protein
MPKNLHPRQQILAQSNTIIGVITGKGSGLGHAYAGLDWTLPIPHKS